MSDRIYEKLKEIWKDPVWSKVISAGIIFIVGVFYTAATTYFPQLPFAKLFGKVATLLSYKISTPVWLLILLTTPIAILLITHLVQKYFRIRGLQKHYDLLWIFDGSELVEGPFCPNDRRTLKEVQNKHSFADIVAHSTKSSQEIILKCPQCTFEKHLSVENLEQLRADVTDKIAAQNRRGGKPLLV